MSNVAIFARVSKKSQVTDRQVSELKAYAKRQSYQIVAAFTETISGSTKNERRPMLQNLLELALTGKIQKVLVSEVSRLGRRTSEVLQVLEQLERARVSVFVLNYSLETIKPDGSRNPMAQFLFTLLAEFARMEKELLVERINSGLEEAKRQGKKLGRPAGTTTEDQDLIKKYPAVVRNLGKGLSIRQVSKLCDVADNTVQKVKKALIALEPVN
jgi:DNA invertase Pin-like site-specific DNA recombinase